METPMITRLLSVLALCLLSACGASDPAALTDAGAKALNSGKYEEAAKSYEEALAQIGTDTSNPDWLRAKMGLVQALIHTDAARAKSMFLQVAQGNPGKVTDNEFNLVGGKLADVDKLAEATEVLDAGQKAFPESVHLKALLADIGNRATSSGNNELLETLKGMGYVGGK
jgi:hypothetical protein